jgi:NTE family protein
LSEQGDEPERTPGENGYQPDIATMTETFTLWGTFTEMTPEACAKVGALALKAKTVSEERWIAAFEENGWPGWPDKPLLVTAVDCESGEMKAFSAESGVPIARAVAASCSVPAMFPPVTIEGRRYTDGGVRSGTSADLAQQIEPDAVLMIAPMGASDRGVSLLAAKQIAREKGELESVGASVRVVMFDEAAKQASGGNLMDATRRKPAGDAGYALGSRLSAEVSAWWAGH